MHTKNPGIPMTLSPENMTAIERLERLSSQDVQLFAEVHATAFQLLRLQGLSPEDADREATSTVLEIIESHGFDDLPPE